MANQPKEASQTSAFQTSESSPQPSTSSAPSGLAALIEAARSASPQEKAALARALGVSTATKGPRRRPGDANEQVRALARVGGGVIRDPNFRPVPPDWVLDREKDNPGFLSAWYERWESGLSTQEGMMDAEEAAAQARM